MPLSIQAQVCWLILAVGSLILPGGHVPKPFQDALNQCNTLLGITPTPFPFQPPTTNKPPGRCEASPDGIKPDQGIAEITSKPIVNAPKDQPILEYNISTQGTPYSYGIELKRFITYVQMKPQGMKEVHRILTNPTSIMPLNSPRVFDDTYLAGQVQPITPTSKDDVVIWSGAANSVKLVNGPNSGFSHLIVSFQPNALITPEIIVYLVPGRPELTESYRVVTSDQFLKYFQLSLPLLRGYPQVGTLQQQACSWFIGRSITFVDPPGIVSPTHDLAYILGKGWAGNQTNLAVPQKFCTTASVGWPVSYNTSATDFNPDGTDTIERISLQSHPYDCHCGSKKQLTCRTYTLNVGARTYTLGNDFKFYKPMSGYMALLNGNFTLLYQGSLYDVPAK